MKEERHNIERKKEWLNEYYWINKEIEYYFWEIERLESQNYKLTKILTGMPGSKDFARPEDRWVETLEDTEEIIRYLMHLIADRNNALLIRETSIEQLRSNEHRLVLNLRYFKRYGWDKISKELGYSERTVYRLHKKALEKLVIPDYDLLDM